MSSPTRDVSPEPRMPTLGVVDALDEAMRLARAAQAVWAAVPLEQRRRRLAALADHMLERMDELVDLVVDENGKRPVEAVSHEVGAAVLNVRWLCEHGWRALRSERVGMRWMPHRRARLQREPWGVVLVIAPWNFPLSIPLGQVVAGLLAGNAVVLKPSEHAPRVGRMIASLLAACALPPDLVAVVEGDGEVGAALIERRPDKVFFTGSLATGRRVMAAAARHPVPVCMELGGVDAAIVLDDADLELASSAIAWGALFNGGQACASIERVLVHESVREVLIDRVVDKLRRLEPATDLGRVAVPRQRDVYVRHLADARTRGLEVRCGGEFLAEDVFAPTVIEGVGVERSSVYRDETFGPVMAFHGFRDDDEAAWLHDALWGGLTASVFSLSVPRARALAERLEVGLVAIDDVAATLHAVPELPWGGVGISGFGRSHGRAGLLEFTRSKVVEEPRFARSLKRPWWFPYGGDQTELMRAWVELACARRPADRLRAAVRVGRAALRLFVRRPRL